ncbi:uncharacterized protein At4g02000-like [Castanea sativa]|uniref:uncharacterized protein At4g02000-like n=1 Tax=Castanea sativa TaxID=21020 RepID=UPI003F64D6EF
MRTTWGMHTSLQIVEVRMNHFQFKFQTDFDLNRVLKDGPWSFDNQLLMLKRWHKGMVGAPFDMVTPQIATEVGSRLGAVEDVERHIREDTPNYFMRVQVAFPISKPLRRGGFIADSDGERTWVNFKYERLPILCHFCGHLRHDLNHYASHLVPEKIGGVVDYQY